MSEGFDWSATLGALLDGGRLSREQCHAAMGQIVSGTATPAQIAAFAVALRAKGETPEEVIGLVDAMLDVAVPLPYDAPALDIVGTGGDQTHSVNLSTLSAIVAAGAGAVVIKHGNRAASSRCGSADVLAELGVQIDLGPEGVLACVAQAGIGFCFAPVFHPAMRHAAVPRREIGVPTVFNILGPLANPARPVATLVGAANHTVAPLMAGVFAERDLRAMVVRGADGMDEVTVAGPTDVWDVTDEGVSTAQVDPVSAGVAEHDASLLTGGDAATNAGLTRAVLAGEAQGPLAAIRDAVILNAGLSLVVWDAALGEGRYGPVTDTAAQRLARAVPDATESIDSGRAAAVLARWVDVSRAHRG